ncbi:murein L,D-transpeptidase catalytic domain family protein [Algoriphagus sp. CAU 1675]|uniref:murein L,D-transpeptidase catalytic domain family protein n=1 Tax=Algoriphagus sp. CAU 1675 TaxID=3032597 RepID=UPI0023DAF853|nr:murein L,D-transpeptidase catalytic domain family protein [Algoriphagus sp. CAU 1675]MDF2158469.1 murein L,D-transpeptidase catalytic domain family protein [Algoriphagus sp. CAU 1675]
MLPPQIAVLILGLMGSPEPAIKENTTIINEIKDPVIEMYDELVSNTDEAPSPEVFRLAMEGYQKLSNELKNQTLTIIDFSLPSTEKRMWIIDPIKAEVLLHSVVSHGRNSGDLMAVRFSNKPQSYQSSLGFYKTAETYQGKHGYSLRLDGLEKGFNDQARNRAIVIHGADYAQENFAKSVGRLGRSLGCPALPPHLSAQAINLIKEGSLLFIFGDDENYLNQSMLLQP